jgi:hypothetical protein
MNAAVHRGSLQTERWPHKDGAFSRVRLRLFDGLGVETIFACVKV